MRWGTGNGERMRRRRKMKLRLLVPRVQDRVNRAPRLTIVLMGTRVTFRCQTVFMTRRRLMLRRWERMARLLLKIRGRWGKWR